MNLLGVDDDVPLCLQAHALWWPVHAFPGRLARTAYGAAAPIQEITAEGVQTADAFYPLDVIVFATGYESVNGPLLSLDSKARIMSRCAMFGRLGRKSISACKSKVSPTCSQSPGRKAHPH
jgi:hypothetical protein